MCDFPNSYVIIVQERDLYRVGVASATFLKKIELCQRNIVMPARYLVLEEQSFYPYPCWDDYPLWRANSWKWSHLRTGGLFLQKGIIVGCGLHWHLNLFMWLKESVYPLYIANVGRKYPSRKGMMRTASIYMWAGADVKTGRVVRGLAGAWYGIGTVSLFPSSFQNFASNCMGQG